MSSVEKQVVVAYLIHNQEEMRLLCNTLLNERKDLMTQLDASFHGDVQSQWKDAVVRLIGPQVAFNTGVDAETIKLVLEDCNLLEYLEEIKDNE